MDWTHARTHDQPPWVAELLTAFNADFRSQLAIQTAEIKAELDKQTTELGSLMTNSVAQLLAHNTTTLQSLRVELNDIDARIRHTT
jgi:hypothetical protein